MSGYIIYHPTRTVSDFDGQRVYYDYPTNNQDPYIWNEQFLHTYCHITQMSPREGNINIWVSSHNLHQFTQLFCDLVFVVADKIYWRESNKIGRRDPLVDTADAFGDHYRWAMYQHPLKVRRRYTLKADPVRSFQPQNTDGSLIDIVPFLESQNVTLAELRRGLRAGFNSKPMRMSEDLAAKLYTWLNDQAPIKLTGNELRAIRQRNTHLASPSPAQEQRPC